IFMLPCPGFAAEHGAEFESASTPEEIQLRQRLLPDDDIWWTVTGEQMAWMHKNVHQLFPTVNVYRAGPVSELEVGQNPEIADFEISTSTGLMAFSDFLESKHSTAMGMVILHQGKIVYEHYPRMQHYEKPIYWSVTKVMPATLIRIYEEQGQIDVDQAIKFYLPELTYSDIADISVRNILDMATGLDCQDEYEDRQSCYYQYSMAIGDGYREDNAADNPYDFLKTLRVSRHARAGEQFSYSGMNTFVLAWLVEKITGEPFQDAFTREIWQHIGAEADASFLAYRYGIPLTHGGFLSNIRDLARFGVLFTPSAGVVSSKQIISDNHIDFLLNSANPNLTRDNGSHNIYQWDYVDSEGFMFKGGWGGQGFIVNPKLDLVAVYTSYFKEDYSQQNLRPVVFDVLRGVYGDRTSNNEIQR
ncbi:MAG: beta-lactamase family protein, partial [Dehalococcoidia bacterium]|nr:beta-lactamase family protein [Dehalococcoidia bacterium]